MIQRDLTGDHHEEGDDPGGAGEVTHEGRVAVGVRESSFQFTLPGNLVSGEWGTQQRSGGKKKIASESPPTDPQPPLTPTSTMLMAMP